MTRPTPQQRIDREMEKLKAMGVTVSVKLGPGGPNPRVMSVLKDAAKAHGIHYGEPDDAPASVDAGTDGVPTLPLDGVPTPGVD